VDNEGASNQDAVVDLTISVINHSNPELLAECLRSILAATRRISVDIWVVDNATDGRLVPQMHGEFPTIHWLFNKSPLGFSANHNQILSQASSRYVCILNDDTIVHEGAFDNLVEFMDVNSTVGMVGARLLNPDGTIQNCTFHFMSLWSELIDICYVPRSANRLKFTGVDPAQFRSEAAEVDWVLGACLVVRKETLAEVGLLDSELSPIANTEEVDWCLRARKCGWKVAYCPTATLTHLGGQSFKRPLAGADKMRVEIHRTRIAFFEKHYGVVVALTLRMIYILTMPWNAFMLTQSLIRRRVNATEYMSYMSTHWLVVLTSLSGCSRARMEACR
jgi:N-acetylglucosaminyl-diphospho-decaprenol L-rhamnosyltransferase